MADSDSDQIPTVASLLVFDAVPSNGAGPAKSSKQILRTPKNILLPIILLFCVVGRYAMTNSMYGVLIMLIMGIIGWILEENGVPVAPIILGLVLGEMFGQNFMTSMIKSVDNLIGFLTRPIAAVLGISPILLWAVMLLRLRGAKPAVAA